MKPAVIGMPDERMGEVACAFVICAPGADLDADAIITYCRESMANYKVPRSVVFLDELPMNAGGKVDKAALSQLSGMENS